jgi:SRSO17 transposase
LPPKKWSGRGRPPKLIRCGAKHQPSSVKALARDLPKRAWRTIEWREGTAERLSSRFALVRVRVAHRDYQLTDNRPEEWLLIEWPETNTGFRPYPKASPSVVWSTSPSCAGASSAITRSSSKRSASATSKDEDGFHHHATL